MIRRIVVLAAFATLLAAPRVAEAVKVQVGEESWGEFRLFTQAWAQGRQEVAGGETSTASDFYLRRARLMLFGNITKEISFFIDTDMPNFGKGGNFGSSMYVQDAVASFTVARELTVDTGLIIVPLTHHAYQGAVALNTLDYHAFLVKYPKDSHKVWRDVGVQARGLFLGDRFQYRAGVFGGVRKAVGRKDDAGAALPDLNPSGVPRLAAHLRYNLFDAEPDLFPQGIYLGKKKVVSFGVAVDTQPRAVTVGTEVADYLAVGGDVFVDLPIGADQEFVFQTNVVHNRQGSASAASGTGVFAEAGWRYLKYEPVVAFQRFFSETGAGDFQGLHLGFNWWLKEHAANVKADLAFERDAALQKKAELGQTQSLASFTLQTQIFF